MTFQYIKEYFRFECEPGANPNAIVQGKKYRFTFLTDRLIRLEYSENELFENRASQTFWHRKQPVPEFKVLNKAKILHVETKYLILKYRKEKRFTPFTLSIQLKQSGKIWYYGMPELGNLKATARTLDARSGACPLEKGLMSKSGFSIYDDSKSLVFDENFWLTTRSNNNKDIYFFGYEKEYLACLNDFYTVAGKTPMIPRYILGNWWSRYWEYSEEELKELISTFDRHKIPLSVCIIDMDWHLVEIDKKYGGGWTGYTWNKELFPDPQRMLNWLHGKNLKVSLNLHPALGIRAHEECYEAVADFMGVDKEHEEPVKFEIADPKFVSAYFDIVHHPLEEMGVDFWWIDWQQTRKSGIVGLDPLWMLNHLHYHDLGREGIKRSVIFSRWGRRGNHRYPIGFSGDTIANWASLRFQPYFTATASNIGFGWWSHDIGGHMLGQIDAELYTRWVQLGVFSPIMRLHCTKNEFIKREPWNYDENTLKYVGDIMRFRHQLIPYIYSMAYRNYALNIPVIFPLYYLEPKNPHSYRFKREFWFGSEIIVSPIVKKLNKRANRVLHATYLPKKCGPFFNFFTHAYHEGGQTLSRVYGISEFPVFVKAGGIIPLSADEFSNGTENPESIRVEIFPGASNKFELYEDDGTTNAYKQDDYYITNFTLVWEDVVKFSIQHPLNKKPYIPKKRYFRLLFNAIEQPEDIVISSEVNFTHESVYNEELKILEIILSSDEFSSLEISFKQPRIIMGDKIMQQAYKMLYDSKIHITRKNFLKRLLKFNINFNQNRLNWLYQLIR